MPGRTPFLLLLAALLTLVVTPAGADAAPLTVAELTRPLRTQVAYADPAVRPRVSAVALRRNAAAHPGFRYVVLSALPRGVGSGQAAADALLASLRRPLTVVVIVRGRLFAASSTYGRAAVATAVRRALRGTDKRPIPTLNRFATYLTAPPRRATAPAAADDGGRPLWQWVLPVLALAALALAALRLRTRSRQARARRRTGSLGTAKDFHATRLDVLSARHGNLVRPVADRSEDAALAEHFELAGGKIAALRRSLPALFSPRELRTCAGELDEVEWHVQSAEALVARRQPPPRPLRDRPGLCFFSHEHGLAEHGVEVDRPDGTTATIRVSGANLAALEAGEPPFVSQVHVGNRLVPWPAAPTWYGAAGWAPADLPGLEYEGREIWGSEMPRRERSPDRAAGAPTPTPLAGVPFGRARSDDRDVAPRPAPRRSTRGEATPSVPRRETPPTVLPADEENRSAAGADRLPSPSRAPAGGADPAGGDDQPEQGRIWEELDAPPPPGLTRAAAADAIGPVEDPRRGSGRGRREVDDERTAAFDPFAEDADPFDDLPLSPEGPRRRDG